jgi:chaperone modulatory protein CbpM
MSRDKEKWIEGPVIDSCSEISIVELCRGCAVEADLVERLVAEGILEPIRREGPTLYFPQSSLKRTQVVVRLRSDLGVNLAGAALALELLERIEELKTELRRINL